MHRSEHERGAGGIAIRRARASDAPLVLDLLRHESGDDLRNRFFVTIRAFDQALLTRMLGSDGCDSAALLAVDETSTVPIGIASLHRRRGETRAEFAILVRSDRKGRGIGRALMQALIRFARDQTGVRMLQGLVLRENGVMLHLCRRLGFRLDIVPGNGCVSMASLALDRTSRPVQGSWIERI